MVGGYKIIDLKGVELSTVLVRVPGIYSSIESNISKPFLVQNYTTNGVERSPFFSTIIVANSTGSFIMSAFAGTTTIATMVVATSDEVHLQYTAVSGGAGNPAGEEPSASM